MLFSQRYHLALSEERLSVVIPDDARLKLATNLVQFDTSWDEQRPNDSFWFSISVSEEAICQLDVEHGRDRVQCSDYGTKLSQLIKQSKGSEVFDLIELFLAKHPEEEQREKCRVKINGIFDRCGCAWRISDGEFFKLDADFIGVRVAADAHDSLSANKFVGAADEYAKARRELDLGEVKGAILHACKSVESVIKVMSGKKQPVANKNNQSAAVLANNLLEQKYFDDLPEDGRLGFAGQFWGSLAFLRNHLAAHGQGTAIVELPHVYGVLAIQLAAALHNFLITKHLASKPPEAVNGAVMASSPIDDDDCPF